MNRQYRERFDCEWLIFLARIFDVHLHHVRFFKLLFFF